MDRLFEFFYKICNGEIDRTENDSWLDLMMRNGYLDLEVFLFELFRCERDTLESIIEFRYRLFNDWFCKHNLKDVVAYYE